jgi:ABC-type glycerol-3-phosphate transport system substrate-binding protein
MDSKVWTRRAFLKGAGVAAAALLAGCAPKVVEVTRVVKEKEIVKETVVVSKEVAKEVTKVVQQTVVVEKVKDMILIRLHSRLGDAKKKVYEASIARLQAAQPQVKVNIEEFPEGSATYGPKIAALVAGNAVGDLTWNAIGTGSFQFLASNKALAAIDDMVAADKSVKLEDWYPRVLKGFRMSEAGQGSGNLYGLPTDSHGVQAVLFYNQDLIEKEGQKLPTDDWTLDNLVEFGLKMTKDGRFGYAPVVGDYSNMRNHTLRFGGEIISEDGKKSLIDDEKCKQAFQWVADCYFKHKISPTAQQIVGNQDQMFLAGKLVAWASGGWGYNTCKTVVKDAFKWGLVMHPKGPSGNRGAHLHADSFAITAASKNKPLTYELIKFLTDKEAGVGYGSMYGLAARFDVFQDARLTKEPLLVKIAKTTEEALEHRGSFNNRKQELQTTINALFGPVWTGDKKLDAAFYGEASKTLQTFLDKKAE